MNRKYLASLALGAAFVLAIGIFIRGRLQRAQPSAPAPPSEASALQQLSQDGQLERISDFLATRIAAVAPRVVYIATVGAAGFRFGQGDTLVTTLAGRPVISVAATARDTGRAAPPAIAEPAPNDWLLVVGRTPEGRVVSSAGLFGGRAVRQCGNESLAELVLGVALHDSFAGAGLFNLDGQLVGMVVRCAGQMAAIPMAEATRLLATTASLAARVWDGYGFAVSPLDSLARAYFARDSGVLVVTVRQDAPAALGLRPGDVILGVDDQRVAAPDDLAVLVGGPPAEHDVVRRRGKSDARVRILRRDAVVGTPTDSARSADAGIRLAERSPPEGVIIDAVRAESPAGRAGLRRGDRLLEVGGRAVRDPRTARRLLERREGVTLVVFERDSAQRGVLLPR